MANTSAISTSHVGDAENTVKHRKRGASPTSADSTSISSQEEDIASSQQTESSSSANFMVHVFVVSLMGLTCLVAPILGDIGRNYQGSIFKWIASGASPLDSMQLNAHAFGFWAGWMVLQIAILKLSPFIEGAATPKNNVPLYRGAGVTSLLINLAVWSIGWPLPRDYLYTNLVPVLCAAHVLALVYCVGLVLKGYYAPSSSDSGSAGSAIMDFYWGTELHPEVAGVQLKQLINCRTGMMMWPIMILSYAAASKTHTPALLVSVGLQLFYVLKFFAWEGGYLRSMDMQHDRAGYYTQWGCWVWVPSFYTCATLAYVNSSDFSFWGPAIAALVGAASIYANWDADVQKFDFRMKGDDARIWGKKPESIPTARKTKLLVSGWWGVARHVHYVFEILGALLWCLPGVPLTDPYPIMYAVYLTILLGHRLFRDDERCQEKYGEAWDQYCARVPYRLIPYVF